MKCNFINSGDLSCVVLSTLFLVRPERNKITVSHFCHHHPTPINCVLSHILYTLFSYRIEWRQQRWYLTYAMYTFIYLFTYPFLVLNECRVMVHL